MMKLRTGWILIGVLIVSLGAAVTEAQRAGFTITLNPNITSTNYYYNITGGKAGDGTYLYNDSTTIYINETYLNGTIDSRITGTESDPQWTLNYTAYNTTWTSTYNATYQEAYSWGNHAAAGYYSSLADLQGAVSNDFHNLGGTDDDDPESINCGIITGNATDLCTISAGAETDPSWTANYTAYNDTWVSTYNATYQEAYSWGNHALAGYLLTYSDSNASTACSGTTTYLDGEGNCDDISGVYLTSYTETDPVWTANYTACATGNHLYFSSGSLACEADADTQLTEEQVEDFVGGMLGGTEDGIDVTYQDASNDIDFTFDCSDVAGTGLSCSGEDLITNLADAQVPDDLTLDTTSYINTTTQFCINDQWCIYVNGSGYLIMEEVS